MIREKKYTITGCRKGIIKFIILSIFVVRLPSVSGQGFNFLNQSYNPRINALSGAFTAQYGDVGGIFVNPAGLAYINDFQLNFSFVNHLMDMKAGMLALSYPFSERGNLSLGAITFDYGAFEKYNKFGISNGERFGVRDMAVGICYSDFFMNRFAYGITAKYIFSKIDFYRAEAIAVDFGFLYRTKYLGNTSFGLAILNLGYNHEFYQNVEESLPSQVALGTAHRLGSYPLTFNFSVKHFINGKTAAYINPLYFSTGIETVLLDRFILRFGYDYQKYNALSNVSHDSFAGFSFGFGIHMEESALDYSYCDYGGLGYIHNFSFCFHLPGRNVKAIDLKDSFAEDKFQLEPPKNISLELTTSSIIIAWQAGKNMAYHLYARHEENVSSWIKITKNALSRNRIEMKKPVKAGTYYFALTSVLNNKESDLSLPVSVSIK